MILHRDVSAHVAVLPNGPELGERAGPLDGRLVHARGLVDVVGAPVRLHCALLLRLRRRVVRPVRLDDVVLNERVRRPPVERQVRVDVEVVPRAVVAHLARRARLPPLAADPIVDVAPCRCVRAPGPVGVVDIALAVGPEGVEEAVICAGAGLDAALDGLQRGGESGRRRREGDDEVGERDHGGGMRSSGIG